MLKEIVEVSYFSILSKNRGIINYQLKAQLKFIDLKKKKFNFKNLAVI